VSSWAAPFFSDGPLHTRDRADDRRAVPPPWHPRLPARLGWTVVVLAGLAVVPLAVRLDRPLADGRPLAEPTERAALLGTPVPPTVPTTTANAPTTTTPAATTTTTSSTTATTPTTAAPATAPDIEPGPLRAAAPGTYGLRVVADGSSQTGTLRVDTGGRQRESVGGSTSSRVVRWSTVGDTLVASHDPGEPDCAWSPAPTELPGDLHEGRTWSTTASCTTSSSDGPSSVTRSEDASVASRARTTFDDRPVDCWLIRRHIVETIRSEHATITTEAVRSELFAPALGLAVYRVERLDVPDADGSIRSATWSTELLGPPTS